MSENENSGTEGNSPFEWITAELQRLESADLRRWQRVRESPHVGGMVQLDGRQLVDFGSNDYLGLAADGRLIDAVRHAAGEAGWGSGASPLISGYGVLHRRLELELAKFEQAEAALLLPTGFAANVATITALAGPGDLILSDALNHASLIDGCRLSRAETAVFRHGDAAHAAELLEARRRTAKPPHRVLVVVDGLFSMDGDFAPLQQLEALARENGAMLLVDEAHASGVWGASGRGSCEELGIDERNLVRVGTLSKALGSLGGFVVGPAAVIEWIRNSGRPYIFSTAQPEAVAAASLAALRLVQSEPQRRIELREKAAWLRAALVNQGWDIGASASQIIPLQVGAAAQALRLSTALSDAGMFVPAIRPPAVPEGSCRLRISLSWLHPEEQLRRLVEVLGEIREGTTNPH